MGDTYFIDKSTMRAIERRLTREKVGKIKLSFFDNRKCDINKVLTKANAVGLQILSIMSHDEVKIVKISDTEYKIAILAKEVVVKEAAGMFCNIDMIKELDISSLDFNEVSDTTNMFRSCSYLKKINFGDNDFRNVETAEYMFAGLESIESIDISMLNFSHVKSLRRLFQGCLNVKSIKMTNMDLRKVTMITAMFQDCEQLTDVDISGSKFRDIKDLSQLFMGCTSLVGVDLSPIRNSGALIGDALEMFAQCRSLVQINLDNLKFDESATIQSMFYVCTALVNLDLRKVDFNKPAYMGRMFSKCNHLLEIRMPDVDMSNVKSLEGLYDTCASLEHIDVSWMKNTDNIIVTSRMFRNCGFLEEITGLENICTNQLVDAQGMFYDCVNLSKINLPNVKFQSTTTIEKMFMGCRSLEELNIEFCNENNNKEYVMLHHLGSAFHDCTSLVELRLPALNIDEDAIMTDFIQGCKNLKTLYIPNITYNCIAKTNQFAEFCDRDLRIYLKDCILDKHLNIIKN